LILDEPTNDLDLPTLGVLENFLSEFQGCLVIVSHDRYFMDRLVDHLFVFEGDGNIRDFPGNYSQYRDETRNEDDINKIADDNGKRQTGVDTREAVKGRNQKKLTYKEKREFEILEKEINQLEKEKIQVTEKLNSGAIPFDELQALSRRIGEITTELDFKELRWLELSEAGE
jgi:ATP-binding cassette subfamily F protein uup